MGGGLQFLNTKSWHASRRESFEGEAQEDAVTQRELLDELKKQEELKKMEDLRHLYDEELRKEKQMEMARDRSSELPSFGSPVRGSALSKMGSHDSMHICDMAARATDAQKAAAVLLGRTRPSFPGSPEYGGRTGPNARASDPLFNLDFSPQDDEATRLRKQVAAMEEAIKQRDAQIDLLQMQVATLPITVEKASKPEDEH